MAGMAFTNAFLGVNHSMAHKIGGEFHVSHGRANAILLPYTIEYNGSKPSKFVPFPKYEYYKAPERFQEISRFLGLKCSTPEEGTKSLIAAVKKLMKEVNMPTGFGQCGINKDEYESKIPKLADDAFEDQCTTANPRMPLVTEIEEILRKAY